VSDAVAKEKVRAWLENQIPSDFQPEHLSDRQRHITTMAETALDRVLKAAEHGDLDRFLAGLDGHTVRRASQDLLPAGTGDLQVQRAQLLLIETLVEHFREIVEAQPLDPTARPIRWQGD